MLPAGLDLTGRAALVTGAGSETGIGFAAARALAELGASVTVAATSDRIHDRAGELTAQGYAAHGAIADLTDAHAAQALGRGSTDHWGRLDIVINNAGMTSVTLPGSAEGGDALALDADAWRASLARNLDSAYYVSRAAIPAMRASG